MFKAEGLMFCELIFAHNYEDHHAPIRGVQVLGRTRSST